MLYKQSLTTSIKENYTHAYNPHSINATPGDSRSPEIEIRHGDFPSRVPMSLFLAFHQTETLSSSHLVVIGLK